MYSNNNDLHIFRSFNPFEKTLDKSAPMKIILALILGLITITSAGQNKKDLTLSFSTGKLTSPYYPNDKATGFYGIDFDYHLTTRQVLSANFNAGGHDYYDNVLSNTAVPLYENTTNAKAAYRTFSILYKYKFLSKKTFSVDIGVGAGIMSQIKEYSYREGNSYYFRQSGWTDLVFPVRLEFDYKLSKHFQLGLIGGFFIHPDFPILAYHAGPRLSYILK